MSNIYKQQPFRSFNTDLQTRRGGYRPGTLGVSDVQGRMPNFDRPGKNPLRMGAGVSSMTARPFRSGTLTPADFNIYSKQSEGDFYANLYRKRG